MSTQIKKSVDVEAGTVTFSFPDGEAVTVKVGELPEAMQARSALHGISQKVGDSYAGAASQERPMAYAKQRVKEVIEQLFAGDWRATTETGPRASLLARALARVTGKELEEAIAAVDLMPAKSDDPAVATKARLNADPRIKKAKAEIKAEDAAKQVERTKDAGEGDLDLGGLFE